MKLIAGLGNPDKKYQNTRHNLGFMIVESYVLDEGLVWQKSIDWICNFAKKASIVIIKPTTYMNKSGESVREVANFFKIANEDILVVHDEIDLPFGKIRLSFNGLSAGHRGVESVIETLGGADFARLRIGIDKPAAADPEKYVLQVLNQNETKKLSAVIKNSREAIRSFINEGIVASMNKFN